VHWARWLQAYRVLALLAVLVVISLQSGAAVMYGGSVEPGWHDTLLPAFYLITAAFSGVAVIGMGAAVARGLLPLSSLITDAHLDIIGRLLIGAGLLATYCYAADFLFTAYGGDAFERATSMRRLVGPYAWSFWGIVLCALLPIHLLWFRRLRRSGLVLFAVGLLVLVGMWCDRFMSIVVTLQHDFLPSSSHGYDTSFWAVATFAGSMGLFATMWLLFLRYLPAVSITELRLLAREDAEAAADG
jgi:Ni/Fe-hydrogenase subunit HybB-like protein